MIILVSILAWTGRHNGHEFTGLLVRTLVTPLLMFCAYLAQSVLI
jgi:hypothetical protein